MAKKHATRPALRAYSVYRYLISGKLDFTPVKRTAAVYLNSGRNVYQTWLVRDKKDEEKPKRKYATTYLGKGIFLIPIWIGVPDWEIEFLKTNEKVKNIPLTQLGIAEFNSEFRRLCYTQVEDLEHARRMTVHILDQYAALDVSAMPTFQEMFSAILKAESIGKVVEMRKMEFDNLFATTEIKIKKAQRGLENFLNCEAIFTGEMFPEDMQAIVSYLRNTAETIESLTMRPIGRATKLVSKSLQCTISHLKNNRFRRARKCMESALKNIHYP
ncbi:hypothetical protein A2V71_02910 [Candidatus Berkelbacteria bacterium RBG_13_40_8]|uniref:Uncharacterized protein n=1 Tax=Candidatus Berkelbacteria bacterium RBG_13_40_8 TaxID=1797467 RepID=A0A1F5DM58_9BACT|nr:MAG: hypothetical protein A2V71_02910 [Candidatus Berkelbacteria bacterium RBG_13_40_8]